VLHSRRCGSCSVWRHKHPGEAECAGCGRTLAVKDGHCRLCWQQARHEAKLAGGLPRGAVSVLQAGERLRQHQLFFDRMKGRRPESPVHQHGRRGAPRKPPPAPAVRPACRWIQPGLFEARRDFTRVDESTHADLGNPWLTWGLYLAYCRGEARGWRRGLRFGVRRALIIVLSRHAAGDKVCYSEIFPALRARDISVERVAEVLQEMGVLTDDRRPSFEGWLERKLDGLAAGIRQDVEAWLRTMRNGGPRTKPRDIASVWNLLNHLRPTLTGWSDRYDHLREVTRDDVIAILGELHGSRRSNVLVALRSLFAFCKKQGTIFRNPARGIKVGQHPYGIAQPLGQDDVDQAAGAAATPTARLVLVPAAVHAARTGAIRAIQLDDVDMGNRRLNITGRVRPIGRVHPPDPARLARLPAHPLAGHRQPAPAQRPAVGDGHQASQHDLLRQDQTPRPGRDPGTAARRPATRGSPRSRPRPPASGGGVRPRPQDRHPLRRERPAAPGDRS
jgi:hypothetical protein